MKTINSNYYLIIILPSVLIITFILKVHCSLSNKIIFQESKELRDRKRREETRNLELEMLDKNEDFLVLAECFQRNSAESACPNTAKGIFVGFQEAFDIFRRPKNF